MCPPSSISDPFDSIDAYWWLIYLNEFSGKRKTPKAGALNSSSQGKMLLPASENLKPKNWVISRILLICGVHLEISDLKHKEWRAFPGWKTNKLTKIQNHSCFSFRMPKEHDPFSPVLGPPAVWTFLESQMLQVWAAASEKLHTKWYAHSPQHPQCSSVKMPRMGAIKWDLLDFPGGCENRPTITLQYLLWSDIR